MGRWDADQAQQLGLDPAEVLAFFYPTGDQASLRANAPPEGEWLLATYAGKAAGCGAFRRIDANTCELQYVYVRDEYRGKRIGCTISRNGPARFRVNGPTLHGLPAEPRFGSFTRPFSLRQVFWL